MTKERISSNVDRKLAIATKKRAAELGVSISAFIETAVRGTLGEFNIYQKNKALKEKNARLETQLGEKADACQRLSQSRDNMQGERDYADDSREKFKEKCGEMQTAYEIADKKNKAYENQPWWERLFRVKPTIV